MKRIKVKKAVKKDKKREVRIEADNGENAIVNLYNFKSKKDKFIAIILKSSKDAIITYVPNNLDVFHVDGHSYFNVASGKYLNSKTIICIYIEGCILPIEHSQVIIEEVYSLYLDDNGNPVDSLKSIPKDDRDLLFIGEDGKYFKNSDGYFVTDVSERIKGLEFDSKTANVLFESNLTDKMASDRAEKMLPIMFVFMIVMLILNIATLGLLFYFNQGGA